MTAALPPDPAEVLTRLEELHKAATAGVWTPATAPSEDSDETHAEYLTGALRPDDGRPLWVAWAPVVEGLHDDSDYVVPVVTGDGPASEANARFVAAAHEHIPALLAAVRGVWDEHNGRTCCDRTGGSFDSVELCPTRQMVADHLGGVR